MNEISVFLNKDIYLSAQIPPSKSYAQRAIAISALAQNNVVIKNLGKSEDVAAALKIIEQLGAVFIKENEEIIVSKEIDLDNSDSIIEINAGESGLSARLFSSFSLLFNQTVKINGIGSILGRPMDMVIDGLKQFGKKVESNNGKLPLIISGEINVNNKVKLDGSISSQFLTGLLIVSPFLKSKTEIFVGNLKSKPYVAMTLDLMRRFGLEFEQREFHYFSIEGNQDIARPVEYDVEGDWSAASFLIVAGAIGGKVKLHGLKKYSKQGDRDILNIVQKFGATVEWEKENLIITKNEKNNFEFDAAECPDLFPPLVVLAAYANGKSIIKGVNRLEYKESNRAVALQKECKKAGIKITIAEDEMIIDGKGKPEIKENTVFSSHNDHRIAMAMSLFSIEAEFPIKIENPKVVDKSYPDFFIDIGVIPK